MSTLYDVDKLVDHLNDSMGEGNAEKSRYSRKYTSENFNDNIKKLPIPVESIYINILSWFFRDAGRYLCEFVYFKSLYTMNRKALFIHVPTLDVFTPEKCAQGIKLIAEYIVKFY